MLLKKHTGNSPHSKRSIWPCGSQWNIYMYGGTPTASGYGWQRVPSETNSKHSICRGSSTKLSIDQWMAATFRCWISIARASIAHFLVCSCINILHPCTPTFHHFRYRKIYFWWAQKSDWTVYWWTAHLHPLHRVKSSTSSINPSPFSPPLRCHRLSLSRHQSPRPDLMQQESADGQIDRWHNQIRKDKTR